MSAFDVDLLAQTPASYRVIAFMPVYNEADILETTIRRLGESGAQVYVLDNGSTDGSWEIVHGSAAECVIGAERIPPKGPRAIYDLRALAARIGVLSSKMRPDWSIWHDADEYFQAPWGGASLRSSLARVEREGFNAVSFRVITFHPIDNSFRPGHDFVGHFRHWTAAYPVPNCVWIRAWMGEARDIRIREGNHEACFAGRLIHRDPFILRHYPVRSQEHGERKVFHERRPRYSREGRSKGWHIQYEHIKPGDSFLWDPDQLHELDESNFRNEVWQHWAGLPCELCSRHQPAAAGPKILGSWPRRLFRAALQAAPKRR